ncbi:monooxygenase, partial [Lactobacillus parabuchneri]|nr:monooxygenase [Lentilactobacillus parabuchneri]
MKEQIVITFGDEKILSEIKAAHPERDLVLYQALSQQGEFMLLDHSGQ